MNTPLSFFENALKPGELTAECTEGFMKVLCCTIDVTHPTIENTGQFEVSETIPQIYDHVRRFSKTRYVHGRRSITPLRRKRLPQRTRKQKRTL